MDIIGKAIQRVDRAIDILERIAKALEEDTVVTIQPVLDEIEIEPLPEEPTGVSFAPRFPDLPPSPEYIPWASIDAAIDYVIKKNHSTVAELYYDQLVNKLQEVKKYGYPGLKDSPINIRIYHQRRKLRERINRLNDYLDQIDEK